MEREGQESAKVTSPKNPDSHAGTPKGNFVPTSRDSIGVQSIAHVEQSALVSIAGAEVLLAMIVSASVGAAIFRALTGQADMAFGPVNCVVFCTETTPSGPVSRESVIAVVTVAVPTHPLDRKSSM
jgi:hypothetical protein